jgi:hypothetical protein
VLCPVSPGIAPDEEVSGFVNELAEPVCPADGAALLWLNAALGHNKDIKTAKREKICLLNDC